MGEEYKTKAKRLIMDKIEEALTDITILYALIKTMGTEREAEQLTMIRAVISNLRNLRASLSSISAQSKSPIQRAITTQSQQQINPNILVIREKMGNLMIYPTANEARTQFIVTVYCEGRIKVRFILNSKEDQDRLIKLLTDKKQLIREEDTAKIDIYVGKIIQQ